MSNRSMGELISTLRKEKAMTQRELAEKLNVTDKAVSKWERNLSCPDVASIPALADALGVSSDELLRAAGGRQAEAKSSEIIDLVLKAIPLAMGVSVIVATLLNAIDAASGLTLLGIGLCCLSLRSFREGEK